MMKMTKLRIHLAASYEFARSQEQHARRRRGGVRIRSDRRAGGRAGCSTCTICSAEGESENESEESETRPACQMRRGNAGPSQSSIRILPEFWASQARKWSGEAGPPCGRSQDLAGQGRAGCGVQ